MNSSADSAYVDDLLMQVHGALADQDLARVTELLDHLHRLAHSPSQALRIKLLGLAAKTGGKAQSSADRFTELHELQSKARDAGDPKATVDVFLVTVRLKVVYGMYAAAVGDCVEAVELCVRHQLKELLDYAVRAQSLLLTLAGLHAKAKVLAQHWLEHQPALADHALCRLWSSLGTAEYHQANEQHCMQARLRSIAAHQHALAIAKTIGGDRTIDAALGNLSIGHTLAGNLESAEQYLNELRQLRNDPVRAQSFDVMNRAWDAYAEALLMFAKGQLSAGKAVLKQACDEAESKRKECLDPLIKIHEMLLQHPDPTQAGQDVRAWAAELARLHEQRTTLQMEVVTRGFEGMVQSAEIAGQNRALRQHGDELTRELAQRNQVLSETVAELNAQGLRRERAEAALQQAHDELELRVVQRTEQLHEARIELARHERVASLSRLVSGVAHRLNTPLGNARMAVSCVIAANAQFKQRMANPMTRRDLVEFVESGSQASALAESSLAQATELMTVFKQVSTLEHVESTSAFDPAALVREAARVACESVSTKKVEVHFDMPALPACQGYPQLLLQVLKQLLVNALLYGQTPGEEGGIWVEVRADSAGLCINVRDKGPGISAERLERIFEPFNSDLSGSGLGLGLHIARNLVTDLIQGSLTANSTPGQGACFTLQLPLQAV